MPDIDTKLQAITDDIQAMGQEKRVLQLKLQVASRLPAFASALGFAFGEGISFVAKTTLIPERIDHPAVIGAFVGLAIGLIGAARLKKSSLSNIGKMLELNGAAITKGNQVIAADRFLLANLRGAVLDLEQQDTDALKNHFGEN